MSRPIIFVHGYSANGAAFDPLRDALLEKCARREFPLDLEGIDICSYVSLNNEISVSDLAEGFDRALRNHSKLSDPRHNFDAIVHAPGCSFCVRGSFPPPEPAPRAFPSLRRLRAFCRLRTGVIFP